VLTRTQALWILAILASIGDMGTTAYALTETEHKEGNPVIKEMIDEVGLMPALFIAKIVTLLIGAILSHTIMGDDDWVIPLALFLVLGPVTALNAYTIVAL
jgi:positive regulator of sigma E activity